MLKSVGLFFIYMGTVAFSKTYLTPAQHIALLKSRGLQISDEQLAESYLINVGYYRLSAYFYPLLDAPKENHIYKPSATFGKVVSMYTFDSRLRSLLFSKIEKIEVAIRSALSNIVANETGDIFWVTNAANYINLDQYNMLMTVINKEYIGSKEDFIKHFKDIYSDPYPPAWMILEILPFGNMTHIYKNLIDLSLKKKIAQHFGLQPPVFTSWLMVLSGLRNLCCHHSRVWNKLLPIRPTEPHRVIHPWIDSSKTNSQRIYFRCCMIAYLLCTIEPVNRFKSELKTLFSEFPNIDTAAMGFPTAWESEPIWR